MSKSLLFLHDIIKQLCAHAKIACYWFFQNKMSVECCVQCDWCLPILFRSAAAMMCYHVTNPCWLLCIYFWWRHTIGFLLHTFLPWICCTFALHSKYIVLCLLCIVLLCGLCCVVQHCSHIQCGLRLSMSVWCYEWT